jgi:hypothetical protein
MRMDVGGRAAPRPLARGASVRIKALCWMPQVCRTLYSLPADFIYPHACAPGGWHTTASDRGSKGPGTLWVSPCRGGRGQAAPARRAAQAHGSAHATSCGRARFSAPSARG